MSQKISQADTQEFQQYLRACTDAQCQGVLEKEESSHRKEYAELARLECARRGLF